MFHYPIFKESAEVYASLQDHLHKHFLFRTHYRELGLLERLAKLKWGLPVYLDLINQTTDKVRGPAVHCLNQCQGPEVCWSLVHAPPYKPAKLVSEEIELVMSSLAELGNLQSTGHKRHFRSLTSSVANLFAGFLAEQVLSRILEDPNNAVFERSQYKRFVTMPNLLRDEQDQGLKVECRSYLPFAYHSPVPIKLQTTHKHDELMCIKCHKHLKGKSPPQRLYCQHGLHPGCGDLSKPCGICARAHQEKLTSIAEKFDKSLQKKAAVLDKELAKLRDQDSDSAHAGEVVLSKLVECPDPPSTSEVQEMVLRMAGMKFDKINEPPPSKKPSYKKPPPKTQEAFVGFLQPDEMGRGLLKDVAGYMECDEKLPCAMWVDKKDERVELYRPKTTQGHPRYDLQWQPVGTYARSHIVGPDEPRKRRKVSCLVKPQGLNIVADDCAGKSLVVTAGTDESSTLLLGGVKSRSL